MTTGIPLPLMTFEMGSFARFTIVERKPQIIHQVIQDNSYPAEIIKTLGSFRDEIAERPLRPLTEQAPDVPFWNQESAAYMGKSWLDLPWYFAETFFYRRLLEIVRYFQPGTWKGVDPFATQKRVQEEAAVIGLSESWRHLVALEPERLFEVLLHSCLWANRADLSNFSIREQVRSGLAVREERTQILIDHTESAYTTLASGLRRVDFITDNAGWDLLFDLALADFLLRQGWVGNVVFHLKGHPFFVSDAMPQDGRETITRLHGAPEAGLRKLGRHLDEHIAAGRLVLKDDPFWTSPLVFRRLPPSLHAELAQSDLVILKGDVNYRRLLDDAHWPHTARMEEIVTYFPAPLLTLRTLKGEIMVGLKPGQAEKLAAHDPTWLINGKWGVLQLVG